MTGIRRDGSQRRRVTATTAIETPTTGMDVKSL
jgi:hypothetical protein